MIYRIKDGFVIRKIGPQTMAVPVGKRTAEIHGMIALTESGAFLWKFLLNGADEKTLVNALLDEYEVDELTAQKDVKIFIEGLGEQGVLE